MIAHAFIIGLFVCSAPEDSEAWSPRPTFRSLPRCGHNCLTGYIHSHVIRRPYPAIVERLGEPANGVPLTELAQVATEMGVPSVAEKVDYESLAALPMPVIVHFHSRQGHYVLVAAADETGVRGADLVSCRPFSLPKTEFQSQWSGYVVRPKNRWLYLLPLFLAGGLAGIGLVFLWKVIRSRPKVSVCVLLLCAVGCGRDAAVDGKHEQHVQEYQAQLPIQVGRYCLPGLHIPIDEITWQSITQKFMRVDPSGRPSELIHHLENRAFLPALPADKSQLWDRMHESLVRSNSVESAFWYRDQLGLARLARKSDSNAESHPGQVLAYFARTKQPISLLVQHPTDSCCIGELLASATQFVDSNQEIEWLTTCVALYRFQPANQKGCLLETLVRLLLAKPIGTGSCAGTHTLQTLALVSALERNNPFLTDAVRDEVDSYLDKMVYQLDTHIIGSGFWAPSWHLRVHGEKQQQFTLLTDSQSIQSALVTGHHFEWFMLLEPDRQPTARTQRRALLWMAEVIRHASDKQIKESLCAYSHCFHAVAAYRREK